jgi:hypothetical protein
METSIVKNLLKKANKKNSLIRLGISKSDKIPSEYKIYVEYCLNGRKKIKSMDMYYNLTLKEEFLEDDLNNIESAIELRDKIEDVVNHSTKLKQKITRKNELKRI